MPRKYRDAAGKLIRNAAGLLRQCCCGTCPSDFTVLSWPSTLTLDVTNAAYADCAFNCNFTPSVRVNAGSANGTATLTRGTVFTDSVSWSGSITTAATQESPCPSTPVAIANNWTLTISRDLYETGCCNVSLTMGSRFTYIADIVVPVASGVKTYANMRAAGTVNASCSGYTGTSNTINVCTSTSFTVNPTESGWASASADITGF